MPWLGGEAKKKDPCLVAAVHPCPHADTLWTSPASEQFRPTGSNMMRRDMISSINATATEYMGKPANLNNQNVNTHGRV